MRASVRFRKFPSTPGKGVKRRFPRLAQITGKAEPIRVNPCNPWLGCSSFSLLPSSFSSGNDILHHVAVHIGQAIVAALEFVSVFLVIDAEQV